MPVYSVTVLPAPMRKAAGEGIGVDLVVIVDLPAANAFTAGADILDPHPLAVLVVIVVSSRVEVAGDANDVTLRTALTQGHTYLVASWQRHGTRPARVELAASVGVGAAARL